MSCWPRFLSALVVLAGCIPVATAAQVNVWFQSGDRFAVVQREVPEGAVPAEAALKALAAGPTEQEQAQGITSALPQGTTIERVVIDHKNVTVEFSPEMVSAGVNDLWIETVFKQVSRTLEQFELPRSIRLTVADALLSDYLPLPLVRTEAEQSLKITAPAPVAASAGTALAGRKISLSPGHGLRWSGSGWNYERPQYCAPLNNEDLHNVELAAFLNIYLLQDGAIPKVYRCLDKGYGNYDVGKPWWTMSAAYWLQHIGYPCSVYASSTGDCVLGSGADESSDSLRSRPFASNYDNTDIYISIHTDGSSGYCVGPTCPTGTLTIYDASGVHAPWGTVSQQLASNVNTSIVSVVRNHYGDTTWTNRGLMNANGAYAETRLPERAAILIELAFHDTCDRDALYLRDPWFHSVTMWGVYKGVCDYFGVTPSYDFYSADYVSDTIPSHMLPGQTYEVSITFRNRGVMWTSGKQFRLGAVGDSDPLTTTTRMSVEGDVLPGAVLTFPFTMTAPTVPDTYTTDWQMLREGITWFGALHSKQVEVSRAYARGDWDEDGDVDLEDFGKFQACLSGTGIAQDDPNCQKSKLDFDSDVDAADMAIFQACMTAPNQDADPYCGF